MRYRYQLRTPSGETISRHSSYLGALDAIAALRARAAREGRESSEYIHDAQTDQPAGRTLPEESPDLVVRLSPAEKGQLRDVARAVGATAVSGRIVGEPSIGQLVKQIAAGELAVTRKEGERAS